MDDTAAALVRRILDLAAEMDDGTMVTCKRCGQPYRRMHGTEHLRFDCPNPPRF